MYCQARRIYDTEVGSHKEYNQNLIIQQYTEQLVIHTHSDAHNSL